MKVNYITIKLTEIKTMIRDSMTNYANKLDNLDATEKFLPRHNYQN